MGGVGRCIATCREKGRVGGEREREEREGVLVSERREREY